MGCDNSGGVGATIPVLDRACLSLAPRGPLFAGHLPGGRWPSISDLAILNLGNHVELEIISETIVPDNGDTRALGVAVGGIWLTSD
jgi:hypothetical protein